MTLRRLPAGSSVADALAAYVDRSAGLDACWPWTRRRTTGRWGGYGVCAVGHAGRTHLAHRAAWEQSHGAIPAGLWVLHSCDNPPCCNPAHLFLGTPADNVADMVRKGRDRRPVGSAHPNARLTPAQVAEIRELRRQGLSLAALAKRFSVSRATCHNVATFRTYKKEAS